MRAVSPTFDALWRSGRFIGANRANGRVTVEKDWSLHLESNVAAKDPTKLPFRWWQRADNSQAETEIPNVALIAWDRSIDTDAASCTITIHNQKMDPNLSGQNTRLGQRGYYTGRRRPINAVARWGQADNEWADVLIPNALLRCVDTETEILTRRGWLRHDEVGVGDEALGINPVTGKSEWQVVEEVFSAPHRGEMVRLEGRVHDSLTTANHRWLLARPDRTFYWATSETLSSRSRIPLAAPHHNTNVPVYSDDFVELAAWYFTEGSAEHRLRSMDWGGWICQSSNANPELVRRIRDLFRRMFGDAAAGVLRRGQAPYPLETIEQAVALRGEGLTFRAIATKLGVSRETVRSWCRGEKGASCSREVWREVESVPGKVEFHFTQEVARTIRRVIQGPDKVPSFEFLSSLTQEQLDLFIEVSLLGDGNLDRGSWKFIQASVERMDAFEYACVLAGRPIHEKSVRSDGCMATTLLRFDVCRPVPPVPGAPGRRSRGVVSSAIQHVPYDGIVWCPRVRHGNWVARRNGSVFYTGNTYEGFGAHAKTTAQAVADGDLYLTGVWLIDEVRTGTDGSLQLTCRDMCKLLLEQQLYVPLMPVAKYPLSYSKWRYETTAYPAVPEYDRTDPQFYGPGTEGPKWVPDIGLDVDGAGYAILGTDGGVFCFDTPFYGSRGQGAVQGIRGLAARPQGDGYWAVDAVGEVYAFGAALRHGTPTFVVEPIVSIAATSSGAGYWLLDRGGDVQPFGDAVYHGGSPEGAAAFVDLDGTDTSAGYWLLTEAGQVYAYGDAVHHGNAPVAPGATATGIAARPTSDGYWVCASDGAVFAFGDATFYGRVTGPAAPVVAVVATSTGDGYWLVGQDGGVFAFGDAIFHGSLPPTVPTMGMAAGAGGYWLIAENGAVSAYGAAPDLGSPVPAVDPAPMRGIAMDPLGRGYWLAAEDGAVYAFGQAGFYGRAVNPAAPVVRVVATPTGRGYWLLGQDGGVFAYGDAAFLGSGVGTIVGLAVDMARTSTGLGYWLLTDTGAVYAYGDATYFGNAPVTPPDKATGIAGRPQDDGYWVVSESGGIFALGAAPFLAANGDWTAKKSLLMDPIYSIDASKTGLGYVLVGGDGGVFSFGDAPFEGSLPEMFTRTKRFPGSYDDLADIVKDLLLWSGWLLYGTNGVYGNIETTGTYVEDEIPADTFDKRPVIDAINAICDIVGYEFWIDEEGSARFESVNWYSYGNFMQETGARVTTIPEIDERQTLTSYTLSHVDRPIRSAIIITSDDPLANNESTITTERLIASRLLRGMVKPAVILTPITVTKAEQETMAELIEQHMHFQTLLGSLTCVANPCLQLNDQVRVLEQVTGEVDVHFVRGISSQHDLNTGTWTYTITTNHLGSGRTAVRDDGTVDASIERRPVT